jgi:hypothetical protein
LNGPDNHSDDRENDHQSLSSHVIAIHLLYRGLQVGDNVSHLDMIHCGTTKKLRVSDVRIGNGLARKMTEDLNELLIVHFTDCPISERSLYFTGIHRSNENKISDGFRDRG